MDFFMQQIKNTFLLKNVINNQKLKIKNFKKVPTPWLTLQHFAFIFKFTQLLKEIGFIASNGKVIKNKGKKCNIYGFLVELPP